MDTQAEPAAAAADSGAAQPTAAPATALHTQWAVKTDRGRAFAAELQRPVVDLPALRALCFLGCPDEAPAMRALCWKLMLGVLPVDSSQWASTEAANRVVYRSYMEEFADRPPPSRPHATAVDRSPALDHPLSTAPTSEWSAHFSDADLRHEIFKDVARTQAGMHFFADTTQLDAIKRVLFLWAKMNKGIRYVQGLNEILAPLYFVMAKSERSAFDTECAAFFAFTSLMSVIRDRFDRTMDLDQGGGVFSNLKVLEELIARHLPLFSETLKRFEVSLQFFALRWIVTLCVQDFDLPDVLRLWDSLFGKGVLEFLPFVCLAMCSELWKRVRLLEGDVEFCDLMPVLQLNPREYIDNFDIEALITTAEVFSLEERACRTAADDRPKLRGSNGNGALTSSNGGGYLSGWLSRFTSK